MTISGKRLHAAIDYLRVKVLMMKVSERLHAAAIREENTNETS
jgi:hypothetical protein